MPPEASKMRGKPERFADHYTQATLFWNSQTPVEQRHIINAFRFELTKVQVPAIRRRMVAGLMNVASELAEAVAAGLGMTTMPEPLPLAITHEVRPEVSTSPALSLLARPGDGRIAARRVAILVGPGADGEALRTFARGLLDQGAVPRFIGERLGEVPSSTGAAIAVDGTLETMPSVLFDGVVLAGADGRVLLAGNALAQEFVREQYRHCKTIMLLGAEAAALEGLGVPAGLPGGERDPGILASSDGAAAVEAFTTALGRHRHFEREVEPPPV
jgi:catalase